MKRLMCLFLILILGCVNIKNLSALDCEEVVYEAFAVFEDILELNNSEVTTVRFNYYGMTENLYAVVENDYNNEKVTYGYNDLVDGILTFDTANVHKNIKYVVKLYSVDASCGTDSIRTFSYVTPKYNDYSIADVCKNPYDIDLCRAFYDVSDMSYEDFLKEVESKVLIEESKIDLTFKEFVSKYWLFVVIPLIVISLVYIVRIVLLKRRVKND